MTFNADPNQLIIYALIFLLGLLIGAFVFAGSGRKWKTRYQSEIDRRRELEKEREDRERHWAEQEKEWRERDSLRAAAIRDNRDPLDERPL